MPYIFRPGQRVRIKFSYSWPELAGKEGVIKRKDITSEGAARPNMHGWIVAPDCWGSEYAPKRGLQGGGIFCPLPDQLEPITPFEQGDIEEIYKLLPSLREQELVRI